MDVVKLIVSPAKHQFLVHEDLICEISPVFKAAFQGKFAEGVEKSMRLPEDDASGIECMVKWIYAKRLETATTYTEETSNTHWWYLAGLYGLADKYDIFDLKITIYDEIYSISIRPIPGRIWPPQMSVITYLYANSPTSSKFRKFVVAWYVTRIDCEWYAISETTELVSVPEFAADVARAFGIQKMSKYVDPFSNHQVSPHLRTTSA